MSTTTTAGPTGVVWRVRRVLARVPDNLPSATPRVSFSDLRSEIARVPCLAAHVIDVELDDLSLADCVVFERFGTPYVVLVKDGAYAAPGVCCFCVIMEEHVVDAAGTETETEMNWADVLRTIVLVACCAYVVVCWLFVGKL